MSAFANNGSTPWLAIYPTWASAVAGTPTDYCTLTGIACVNGYVSQINLSHTLMGGTIPASTSSLVNLTVLDVHATVMNGTIPSSLSSLTALTYVDVSATFLSGTVPPLSHVTFFNDSATFIFETVSSPVPIPPLGYFQWAAPGSIGATGGLLVSSLSTGYAVGCVPTFLDLGNPPDGSNYVILTPLPSNNLLMTTFSDALCVNVIRSVVVNSTTLSQGGVAPAQAASYTYSVVATPPSGYAAAGVALTQYSGPSSTGTIRGYAFFPFSTACGLWGPPSDVTYLSCNATHYTVNEFPSDDATCTGTPTVNTYSLTTSWTSSTQDLGVTSAGYDAFSCNAAQVAPPAPQTVTVAPSYLTVSSSNYTANWLLQTCLPRYSNSQQDGYVLYTPALSANGPPGIYYAYFDDQYCKNYRPGSAIQVPPALLAVAYAPAVSSFTTTMSAAYSTAGVVITQYLLPSSTGPIIAKLFQALGSCGSLGPPTDVMYVSTNSTHYTVNVYTSDDGTCTGALPPTLTSFPFNNWDGHDGSGPFDLGPYAGYLSVASYAPSPPMPPPMPPSPTPPPPGSPVVQLAVTLNGVTVAQFQTTAAENAFVLSVATTLGVSQASVTITSVTQSSRRLLSAGGVYVQFTVASSASAASIATQLSTGSAFASALASNFQQAGLPAPTPSAVSVSAPPASSSALAAAVSPLVASAACMVLSLLA